MSKKINYKKNIGCLYEINGFKLDVVKVGLNRISELSKRSTARVETNYVIIRAKGIGK